MSNDLEEDFEAEEKLMEERRETALALKKEKLPEVQRLVEEKMKAAASLILEAAEIVEKANLKTDSSNNDYGYQNDDGLYNIDLSYFEFYNETKPLMGALSSAGWSASSMRC